jgi:hypothetical protein
MHCVQLLLVEADTHQEAIGEVESRLEEADWSDWSEVGGRWQGMFGDDEPTNALNYANDPEVFMKWINTFTEYRTTNIKEALAGLDKKGKTLNEIVDTYDPRVNDFELGMSGYYIRRIGTLLADYWTSDSAIWDLAAGTGNLSYLIERIEKEPKRQFAVIVDFHH